MPVFLSFGVALAVLTFACYRSLKLSERPHRALVLLSPVPKDLLILHGVWLNLRLFNGSFFDTALAFSPFRKASDIRIITAFRRRLLTGPALAYSSTMITATPVHGGLCGVDLLSGPVFAVVAFVLAKSRAGKLLTSARIGASAEQFTGKDL